MVSAGLAMECSVTGMAGVARMAGWAVARLLAPGEPEGRAWIALALAVASLGALEDLRSRTIPNRLTAVALGGGLLLHLAFGGLAAMGLSLAAGLTAGGLFLLLYLAGGMGAGDVKLMAAVGAIVGFALLRLTLLSIVSAGAVSALLIALFHGRLRRTLAGALRLAAHHWQRGLEPRGIDGMVMVGHNGVGDDVVGHKVGSEAGVEHDTPLSMPFAVPIALGCALGLCIEMWKG